MPIADLSRMMQDYLQAIWKASEWNPGPVSMNELATRLDVTVSTVSSGIKRLRAEGLVQHERYGGVELTDTGRAAALQMVRRHRLIETYLVERLGYSWDEVHDEAEHLEHAVSDTFVERIAAELGHPTRDPHGDVIPTADGTVPTQQALLLTTLPVGGAGVVCRISDEHPDVLRYLADRGIGLDVRLQVLGRNDVVGLIELQRTVDGDTAAVELVQSAASAIWVVGA